MSQGVPYSVSNLGNSFGEFQYPQGREIPSMHTGDLQAARPHQNTRSRNVWADEYVDLQIKHEPQKIQRQFELNKRYRNPLFNDYHYQNQVNGTSIADLDFTKNTYNLHNQVDPKLKMNDSLDSFIGYQKSQQQYANNKSVVGGSSPHNFLKQSSSPYIMKVNPGVQQYKPGPFANISTQINDESKSILKRPELVPTRKGFGMDSGQYQFTNNQSQSQNPAPEQAHPNANSNQNPNLGVQNIINNQRVVSNEVPPADNSNQRRVNSQRKQNSLRQETQQPQNQYQNSDPQGQQYQYQPPQNQNSHQSHQAPIKTPNQRYLEDAYRSNQIYSSSDQQAFQYNQQNPHNNNSMYQYHPQRNGSMPNIQANQSMQFNGSNSSVNKQYNITNIVTHKDYLKYQPKYDVGINNIHENLKEKFRVNQFGQFDFKDMAPVDIKKQKNDNIFSSMEGYTTTTRDQQQMYDYWKKMQELKNTQPRLK